jgi:hypothetical protein
MPASRVAAAGLNRACDIEEEVKRRLTKHRLVTKVQSASSLGWITQDGVERLVSHRFYDRILVFAVGFALRRPFFCRQKKRALRPPMTVCRTAVLP